MRNDHRRRQARDVQIDVAVQAPTKSPRREAGALRFS